MITLPIARAVMTAAVWGLAVASAQVAETPTFAVASVKPHPGNDRNASGPQMRPGGSFSAINVPLTVLIRQAYGIQGQFLVGGPEWLNVDRFDVLARAGTTVSRDDERSMLQAMLADRFKLAIHHERRETSIYALAVARSDGRLRSRLRPTSSECVALMDARARGDAPRVPPTGLPSGLPKPGDHAPCGFMRMAPGVVTGSGLSVADFAMALTELPPRSSGVDRIVQDRTGLNGRFDFDLEWTPDPTRNRASPNSTADGPTLSDFPGIFTAVQEQLGLKLESAKASFDFVVIDHVERPTAD